MKKLLFILCTLCFGISVFAQEQNAQTYSLKGIFKNQDSAAIGGIRLEFNNNGKITYEYTDINGEFNVELSPGRYELTINKSISDKFIAFINIEESGLNPHFIEFVVETNANSNDASCLKIITFLKPKYPQAARAVRAMGEVVVEVKIDKAGKVVSAKAVSGHPLLRGASEYAARQSTFEPLENADERGAKLTFVFLPNNQVEKENIKRYSVPCRMEIYEEPVIFNVRETE